MIVVITKDVVKNETLDAIRAQDVDWIISGRHPKHVVSDTTIQTYRNCSENRDHARLMALASKAKWFLFVDSDIVLPPGAWTTFKKQIIVEESEKRILGGWYKIRNTVNHWCCGRWVANNVFSHFRAVQRSLVRTDVVGLGCAFMSRQALTDLHFEHGCDVTLKDLEGHDILLGECGAFGNLAADKGYSLFMDGSVVCGHIE